MEIVEDRDDYCEEEEEEEEDQEKHMSIGGLTGAEMGKHQTFPFYPSSSSPSPASSSSSRAGPGPGPHPNGRWGNSNTQIYEKHQRVWKHNMGGFVDEGGKSSSNIIGFGNYMMSSSQLDAMDTGGCSQSHQYRSGGEGDMEEGSILMGSAGGGGGGGGGGVPLGGVGVEKEHMFDKVVTPSDVGKLNRLVIPKQHAEKYFPLDSSANEKGLLLSFEDRSGKPWRFRYSYWNSSQSYVMTKGWSRFVKEKKLDAGDIVSFERGVGDMGKDRLYIDWKRRPDTAGQPDSSAASLIRAGFPLHQHHHISSLHHRSLPWGRIFFPPTAAVSLPMPPPPPPPTQHHTATQHMNYDHVRHNYGYNYNVVNPAGGSVFYLRSATPHGVAALQHQHHASAAAAAAGGEEDGASAGVPMVFDSLPVVPGGKRLRLFGVNLDCPNAAGEGDDNDVLSSPGHHHAAHATATNIIANSLLQAPQPQPQQQQQQPSPPLQLRLCGGGPLPTSAQDLPRKTRQSLSFDLDI
ncbi:hypothetical protein H6P81_008333 [Aristolochia fimbriata]|uniref:TF-B3 domain-containing protein n=1 Tax=Aristolochia fimbriata TaxID=158543 RepID=A0AAV7F3F1_ARIFI|nr:hypothetical protein H6P81_008333 [Aristolochia fimbriata]